MSYVLNRPRIERFRSVNETILILRTKHTNTDNQYRGFHLTYRSKINGICYSLFDVVLCSLRSELSHQIDNEETDLINTPLNDLPCGKTFSTSNGTIEFSADFSLPLNCLIFIQVDDGQNIFLRFDSLQWDNEHNQIEIGLHHFPNQFRLFQISGSRRSIRTNEK